MIKAYLFDFDGTLVDSMPAYVSIMTGVLDEYGIEYGDDFIKTITPLGMEGTARYFIEELGVKLSLEELIEKFGKNMYYEYANNIMAKENVIPVLKELKERGVSLNVLTASPHLTLDVCLKRLGIFDLFDNVWSCDDFNTTKANPEIYRMAAEKIGENIEEILFLDDNFNADKTAKSAGMKVCGVYDESSAEYVNEMKELTDFYIYDFKELSEIA
ncbi:MAG: HAD family phosphatase [Ruminococcaceae bacterium]|nr:HAD family phosphatase [Oscillospiraceae bacterium]